jgi:hypothetical protein
MGEFNIGYDTYEAEVRLWSKKDLDALQDALNKPWESTGLGHYKKIGFAGKAKCVISDDGGYLCIRFEGQKDISSKAPCISVNVQAEYMTAVEDLKLLIEQRKREEEDQTTNLIP